MDPRETLTEKSARVQREATAVALIARLALERQAADGVAVEVPERVKQSA
jgi:hypothetical protein